VRQELFQFAGLHRVDSGQHIGKVLDRVDLVCFAGRHEREVNGGGGSSGVGTDKETVLPHQDEVFNCPLGNIVVDVEVGVFEESCQSDPVIERVINRRHQGVRRVELGFEGDSLLPKFPDQRFGTDASDCQPFSRTLPIYFPFDIVELLIYIQKDITAFRFDRETVVVSPARMRMAADFDSRLIFEERIKAASGIRLDACSDILKPSFVSFKRLIGREIENCEFEFLGDVDRHLAFAHSSFELPVLDLYFRVICVDDFGFSYLASQQIVKRTERHCGLNRAVALSGTWNGSVLTGESFLLPVMWQAIAESAGNYVSAEGGSVLTVCVVWFFGGDDVDLAFWAGPYLLLMFEISERMQEFVELIAQLVADEGGRNLALRADRVFGGNSVIDRLNGNFLIANVFPGCISSGCWRFCFCRLRFSRCSLRIVSFGLRAKILAIAFLELYDENIELFLKIFKFMPEIFIAGESFAKLFTEFVRAFIRSLQLCFKGRQYFLQSAIFCNQSRRFGVVGFGHCKDFLANTFI